MDKAIHKTNTSRRKRGRRNERGAIAVEAAISAILLVTLFLGTLEFGLLFRTQNVFADATTTTARTASALPREETFHDNSLAAVISTLTNLTYSAPDYLVVYLADPITGEPVSGEAIEECSVDCFRWGYDAGLGGFYEDGTDIDTWDVEDHVACGTADTQYVGVYLRGHFDWVTGFFGPSTTFTEKTIMRFEPVELGVPCRP